MTDESGEVRIKNEITGGEKGQKLDRFDLIPTEPLRKIAHHYGVGAKKYADRNWEKGYDWDLSYGALQRHLNAWWGGEDVDEETGSSHLAAAAFHVLALLEFTETHPELDTRPTTVAEVTDFFDLSSWSSVAVLPGPHLRFEFNSPDEPQPEATPVEPEPVFQVGDRVRHVFLGMTGTVVPFSSETGGNITVDWDYCKVQGTLVHNLVLIERPNPDRASVRKIMKAIGRPLLFQDPRSRRRWYHDHAEVVQILDALEDAGLEIVHKKNP